MEVRQGLRCSARPCSGLKLTKDGRKAMCNDLRSGDRVRSLKTGVSGVVVGTQTEGGHIFAPNKTYNVCWDDGFYESPVYPNELIPAPGRRSAVVTPCQG